MIWGRWGWLRDHGRRKMPLRLAFWNPSVRKTDSSCFPLPQAGGEQVGASALASWSLQPSSFCQALGLGLLQPHLELGLGVLLSPGPLGKEVCDRGGSTRVAEGPSQPFRP